MHYVAFVHGSADGGYGISFPDLPGCIAAGRTMDETVSEGTRALSLHLDGLTQDAAGLPEPRSVQEITEDEGLAAWRERAGLVLIPVVVQTETQQDKRYIRRLREYYTRTENGRERAERICPMPLFVDSELSPCIQAADICLYCVNWGFRHSEWSFAGPRRDDLSQRYAGRCRNLQYQGSVWSQGKSHPTYGIIFVPDPYLAR